MQTSGLVFAIHSLERSKPSNTRCQYGSPVRWLSIAAPIAGTCDDVTPAMILATAFLSLAAAFGFGLSALTILDPAFAYLPDLLRLPSTERPPRSIRSA